jgi:cation diffusion facilitator family transporter
MSTDLHPGIRAAQQGLLVNVVLAVAKFLAGILGHSYALVADAVESTMDIFSSLVVWSGLHVAQRDPDERYPFGYGKAESLAGAVVSLMLLGAATAISIESIREIRTPHHTPAPWTLVVLVAVILIKWFLSRRVEAVGVGLGSSAVQADAWHHMSDALTSAAAFIGISVALVGGAGWEQADDWAALAASAVIALNGIRLFRPALHDLMDRAPAEAVVRQLTEAAESVPDVLYVEKVAVRKSGVTYRVTLHVQTYPTMSLERAHEVSGRVKAALRAALPSVASVLVHMEPYDPASPSSGAR